MPLCAANVPGAHAVQVAAALLVLPVGPPVPAAQVLLQMHWYKLLHDW